MIKINFEDIYVPHEVAKDLSFITFYSDVVGAPMVLIKAEILSLGDPLLPNVCNMAFGPLSPTGGMDDKAKINHQDQSKLLSTILLFSLAYLQNNPQITIGIDGSNDIRAYLYHRYVFN